MLANIIDGSQSSLDDVLICKEGLMLHLTSSIRLLYKALGDESGGRDPMKPFLTFQ